MKQGEIQVYWFVPDYATFHPSCEFHVPNIYSKNDSNYRASSIY